jgi:FAD/FMN-containing dehydrogenase
MMEQQHTTVALEETAVQELASRMRGALLRPGDAGYEQALRVYNGMIDKRPALIAHCVDVADVIAAVNFAREQELTLAVRGGGHSGPGLGTCDDGLVMFGDAERTRRVIAGIQQDGTCWCGGTTWQGQTAMRISVSSWATTDADVERSLEAMIRVARELA